MTIEELKLSKVKTLLDFGLFLKTNSQQGFHYVHYIPDIISNLVADISKIEKPTNAVVLNSNFGEISSKLVDIKNVISIDVNVRKIEIAKYFNPNLIFLNEAPLNYSDTNKFDFVVVFPPFGQKLEVNGRNYSSETLHVEKALTLLSDTGTAIIIIPNNFLTASAYSQIRNTITNQYCLDKIITLPKGTMVTTSIEISVLIIKKGSTLKTDFYTTDSNFEINFSVPSFSVLKENLRERWDFHFHNPKNQIYQEELDEYKTEKIGNLVEIYLGTLFKQNERKTIGKYRIITPRNISKGLLEDSSNDCFIEKENLSRIEQNAVVKKGDILFPRFYKEKVSVYIHSSDDDKLIVNQHILILRGKNAEYVSTYLNTESGINLFNQQIKRHARGTITPVISIQDLRDIQIPILPISDLELASKSKLEKLPKDEIYRLEEVFKILMQNYFEQNAVPYFEQAKSMYDNLQQAINNLNNKIDNIQNILSEMSNDFKQIKSLPRDIEEKISRMNENFDEKLSSILIEHKQIGFYVKEIRRWFEFYDQLEIKSQKFLPEAEFIFDHISKLENPDYSPFILQYCRALENELLSKIFRAYVQSLLDRNVVFDEKFVWDLGKKDSGKPNDENTLRLSKHIQKCMTKNTEDWFFELGTMEVNLRYLTGRTIERSPLLQDLKEFILDRFEKELLNIEYLDEIKTIIKDFRNQSAHPNLMDTEKAIEFHKQIKECLINLMENYKNKGNAKN